MTSAQEMFEYRRKLPHWRLSGATYLITWRLHKDQHELTAPERSLVCSSVRHFDHQRYRLLGYVVMNDHVHVVVEPYSGYRLTAIIQSWKSYAARSLQAGSGRKGSIWQDEYFDRIIRDDSELATKLEYIRTNPEKRWPGVGAYAWMWTSEADTAAKPDSS